MFKKQNDNAGDAVLEEAMKNLPKGSAEAYRMLYERYHNKVYRFCLRMLGDEEQAADAFQETFINIYEHRKEFKGNNFSAWLFTIARHNCLNIIRKRKESESFNEEYHAISEQKTSDVALKDYIQKALDILPETLREALILREYEGYSYQEIADITGTELSLAKVRVFRARTTLRKLLLPLRQELYES